MGAAVWNPFAKPWMAHSAFQNTQEQCNQVSLDCILDRGTSKGGTLCGFISISPTTLVHEYYHFVSVNACTIARSGNLRIPGGTSLLFNLNLSSLFLSNQRLLDLQNCFSFSGIKCWAFLTNFSRLLFWRASLWTITEIWPLIPLRAAFWAQISARWFLLASRESSLARPGISIIAKASG